MIKGPVTLYSNNCPNCMALKELFDLRGIDYEIINDEEMIEDTAKMAGIKFLPFCYIPDLKKIVGYKEILQMNKEGLL